MKSNLVMSTKDTPRYRIQAVAERTGIPAATLRAWERRYGIPHPIRTDSAYRTYSEHDVELVQQLRQLCDSGLSPSDAARLLKGGLKSEAETQPERREPPREVDTSAAGDATHHDGQQDVHRRAVARLVSAVRAMSLDGLEGELLNARSLGTSLQIFELVLRPALEAVGQLWHDGEISISHEHLATELITATTRDLLRLAQPSQSEHLALLACFADELHSVPLYGVGFRLAGWGCRVAILGALTPPAALGPAIGTLRPDFVGLSVTVTPSSARARELVEGYSVACTGVPWVVGGQGVESIANLITECGGLVAPRGEVEARQLFHRLLARR